MTTSANRNYVPEIDQLRAFAALLVLFYHGLQLIGARLAHGVDFDASQHWLRSANPLLAVIEEGHSGVSLFIVLSGYTLSLNVIGHRVRYGPFILARVLRIYPMLLVCLAAVSLPGQDVATVVTTALPAVGVGKVVAPLTAMFWAVAVEFQCYLVFPFLILFSNKIGTRFLLQLVAVAVVFRALAVLSQEVNPRDITYWTTIGRIDQFCIGIITARLAASGKAAALRPFWFAPALATAIGSLWAFNAVGGWPVVSLWKLIWPTIEGAVWAFVIVTYLPAGRFLPRFIAAVATRVGEVSYSLYLVHFAVIAAVIKHGWYLRLIDGGPYDALLTTLAVALPVSVAIAALTFHTIESPFLALRPRYVERA